MWWVLTSQHRLPGFTTLAVLATTNVEDHLFMAWQYFPPTRVNIWRTIRGQRIHCGYQWRWDNPFLAEQLQSGDTINHSFHIRNLTPGSTIWWYNYAPGGPYDREIQGPLNSVKLMSALPAPQPIPAPITFDAPHRILRCGNRYTFWAYGSWYAFVPTSTSLTMWILVADTFYRLDQANEPTPIAGAFKDADARLGTLQFYIHISVYDRAPSPDDYFVHYVRFDITHHAWGALETAHQDLFHAWSAWFTCLALDIHDKPHILFTRLHIGWPVYYYRNKLFTTWSDPEEALWSHLRVLTAPSAAIDPTRNSFHCCCVTHFWLRWYNIRPCGGPFKDTMIALPSAWNAAHHSLAAGVKEPHIAQINLDWKIDHSEGLPPHNDQLDLSDPSSMYANIITSTHNPDNIAIIFRDDDNHLAYLTRPPGAPWNPQVQLPPIVGANLTAHYAHPDVISCLWQEPGFQATTFFAILAPW